MQGVPSQGKETLELLKQVPSSVVGARLRRARQRMGVSIRDLAAAAGVSKNSIVRLEAGGAPHALTVTKICAALGIHVASLAKPSTDGSQVMSIHKHEDDRWFDLTDFGAGPFEDKPLSEQERKAYVKKGAKVPLLILKSRLETGRLLPTVIELFQQSDTRSHAGEEFVYVLKGDAEIRVGAECVVLKEGEAATFWSAEEHSYAPTPTSSLPVRVLSVRIDDKPVR
jgi:transcriptional regulator with XRE-family HTH domain